ncbi:MAG: O-antigen ligase family protein, partial [Pseudobutyrivibrio sp.]|nr:O-antigen ligase family protein [Pseudobutyrivibrio sp.]MCF0185969.1 O-antigen ligase family protein [Bacteroidaceae bacterium]
LTLVFFSNQVFGGFNLAYIRFILPLFGIGTAWCLCLVLKDAKGFLAILKAPFLYWVLAMNLLIFVYGYIWNVVPEAYSRSSQILLLSHLLVIMGILWQERGRLKEVLMPAAVMMLVAESVFVVAFNRELIAAFFAGAPFDRIGETPNAGLIETSMTLAFCMIPLFIEFICRRKWIYALPLSLGLGILVMDGSKVGFLVVAATIFVIAIGLPDEKAKRWRNLGIFVEAAVLFAIVCYIVPVLREAIFKRFADLVHTLVTMDMTDMHSSTSRRLQFAVLAFTHAWDSPIYGHGLATVGHQVLDFDAIEVVWPNSHNNFTEILYSCGLLGVVTYYWFPVYMMIKTIRRNHSVDKLAMGSLLLMMVCFDLSNISFQRNIIGYVAFVIIYLLSKEEKND